jgi:hypothetical protein
MADPDNDTPHTVRSGSPMEKSRRALLPFLLANMIVAALVTGNI